MAAAIQVDGLSKRYRIGQLQSGYETLRDSLTHATRRLARREHRPPAEEIWALRDVSFSVRRARCSASSAGTAPGSRRCSRSSRGSRRRRAARPMIRGRVGSLLEVGTGFHPELTGRENIYPQRRRSSAWAAARSRGKLRRDRRLRRRRAVHGHARQALLERHVCAARVLRRRASRAGDPARRRGARGRRCGVPAAIARADGGVRPVGPDRPLRVAQHADPGAPLRSGDPARRTGGS